MRASEKQVDGLQFIPVRGKAGLLQQRLSDGRSRRFADWGLSARFNQLNINSRINAYAACRSLLSTWNILLGEEAPQVVCGLNPRYTLASIPRLRRSDQEWSAHSIKSRASPFS